MDATSGLKAVQQSLAAAKGTSSNAANGGLQTLSTDNFLNLMIAQLQNQDPLNPTDNNALMQQISDIKNIGATDKLTTTLNSVLLGQTVSSATALIGKQINALSDAETNVSGIVDRVTITNGVPKLHVGNDTVSLNNVSDILPANAG